MEQCPLLHLSVVAIEKEIFGSLSTEVTNNYGSKYPSDALEKIAWGNSTRPFKVIQKKLRSIFTTLEIQNMSGIETCNVDTTTSSFWIFQN